MATFSGGPSDEDQGVADRKASLMALTIFFNHFLLLVRSDGGCLYGDDGMLTRQIAPSVSDSLRW
jgi:hypothetical protein